MYATSARKLADLLNSDEAAYDAFLSEFNRLGHVYFNGHRSGYSDTGENPDKFPIEILTKSKFINKKRQEQFGSNDKNEFPNNEVLSNDEAAFDDSYRHAMLIDMSALPIIKALSVDALGDETFDHIFKWSQVDAFVRAHPDGQYIIVHGDTIGPQFFLPIPEASNGNAKARSRKHTRLLKYRRTRRLKYLRF